MSIEGKHKMIKKGAYSQGEQSQHIEKWLMRAAFDTTGEDEESPFLPHDVLWRQKEQVPLLPPFCLTRLSTLTSLFLLLSHLPLLPSSPRSSRTASATHGSTASRRTPSA